MPKESPAARAAADVHLGICLTAAAAYLAPPSPLPRTVAVLSWIPLDGHFKAAYLGCVDAVAVPNAAPLRIDAEATLQFQAFLDKLCTPSSSSSSHSRGSPAAATAAVSPLSIRHVPHAEAKALFAEQQCHLTLERLSVLNQVEYACWCMQSPLHCTSGASSRFGDDKNGSGAECAPSAYYGLLQDRHVAGKALLALAAAAATGEAASSWAEARQRFRVAVTSNLGLLVMSHDAVFQEAEHLQVLTIALQGRSPAAGRKASAAALPMTDKRLIAESEYRFTMRVAELAKTLAQKVSNSAGGPPPLTSALLTSHSGTPAGFGSTPSTAPSHADPFDFNNSNNNSAAQLTTGAGLDDPLASSCSLGGGNSFHSTAQLAATMRGQIILVTGPSASGKTTFANKLSLALRALGFAPIAISMDEYYRDSTVDPSYPRFPDGSPNHEVVECLRLEELKENIETLLSYGAVELPQFDMAISKPKPKTGKNLKSLPKGSKGVLIVEGIFALSPTFVNMLSNETVTKVFVAPSPDVGITETTVIPNQTVRLVRRISRDFLHRGRNARASIARVPGVEVGEDNGIFPLMRHAEIVFNTFVDYELGLLRVYVLPLLKKIEPSDATFEEAQWLAQLLEAVESVSDRTIGRDALVREFIGGSIFEETPLDMRFDNRPTNLVGKRFSFCRSAPWRGGGARGVTSIASQQQHSQNVRNDGVRCIWDKLDEQQALTLKDQSTVFGETIGSQPDEDDSYQNDNEGGEAGGRDGGAADSEFQSTDVVQGSEESSGDPFERLDTDSIVLAMLNQRQIVPLHLPLEGSDYFHGAELRGVPLNTRDGLKAYDSTAIVLLHVAVKKVLGVTHRLVVLHQFLEEGDRFCVRVQEGDRVVRLTDDDLADISATMHAISKEAHPIHLRFVSPAAAVEMFLGQRMANTVSLLESSTRAKILVAHLCGIPSLALRPLLPNAKFIKCRALRLERSRPVVEGDGDENTTAAAADDACLTFTVGKPNLSQTPGVAAGLFQIERKAVDTAATTAVCKFRERVLAAQRVFSVGELNNSVFSGKVAELVCVDEAIQFQIKQADPITKQQLLEIECPPHVKTALLLAWKTASRMDEIARLEKESIVESTPERIVVNFSDRIIHQIVDAVDSHGHRVVFLAGSSSSGKSVVSSRLRTLLSAKGYATEVLSTDSYYRNLADDDYPKFPNGQKNCDTVGALRVPLLLEQLQRLVSPSLHTGTMQIPTFDLGMGKILPATRAVSVPLPPRGVLIVEGLFALCPEITEPIRQFCASSGVGSPLCVMIHPMPVLNYEELHLMSAKSLRLLRRCVRDYFVRGRTARETLQRRRGVEDQEILNTLPFLQHADLVVSPCCVYEAAALRSTADLLLNYVPDDDHTDGGEAMRKAMELKSELAWIGAISPTQLPDITFVKDLLDSHQHQ